MKVRLYLDKDVNSNAEHYFSKAKKIKSKFPGIERSILEVNLEIEKFEAKKNEYLEKREKEKKIKTYKKKEWYEKFRSTISSGGFLFVIGKDASSNEVLLKKHAEPGDLVFHSTAPGSPFGLLKNADMKCNREDLIEAGEFLLCFSKQWKAGFGNADAFYVKPEQVSKKAPSGEFMGKGSFMIYGEKNELKNLNLSICIGVKKEVLTFDEEEIVYELAFSGSEKACQIHCNNRYIKLEPGDIKHKNLHKELRKELKFSFDDLPKYIPNECRIAKKRKKEV